jgi:hypothetical protein
LDVAGDDDGGDDMDMEDDTVWIPHHFTRFMELLEESFLQEDEHIDTIKGYAASVFFAVNLMKTKQRTKNPLKNAPALKGMPYVCNPLPSHHSHRAHRIACLCRASAAHHAPRTHRA